MSLALFSSSAKDVFHICVIFILPVNINVHNTYIYNLGIDRSASVFLDIQCDVSVYSLKF